MHPERGTFWQRQVLPILLAIIACVLMIGLVYGQIRLLNTFTSRDISLTVLVADILIGFTVYIKTSIDFALFMGNLMRENTGWKNRISIEIGTALGNALGTMVVLFIWVLFKEIDWLLALMILLAALVLFKLAEEGLSHAIHTDHTYPDAFRIPVHALKVLLSHINWFTGPFLRFILPDLSMNAGPRGGFWKLFVFSITIPFVLGLDDFAGYVPIFSLVNVFGFTIGVFVAHALLNIFLYISPDKTIRTVKNPFISVFGSIAFVGLGAWGIFEAVRLLVVFFS
jgi:hypothetical protein